MELIQSKSILAKLMATENLTIEQRDVSTASFDVENRILTVPTLDKNISGYLYDLFLGHEVGHALYTPLDGLKKAMDLKLSMSIMNVLEDVRIERKIKTKYPGIRTSFVKGYNELLEKDFFGTYGTDLVYLNFIDRVNLYTKVGSSLNIKFDSNEKELLKEIQSTDTYDEVIAVCKKVMDFMKEQQESKKQMKSQEDESDDEEENDDDSWGNFDFDEDFSNEWNDDDFEEESESSNEESKNTHEEDADSSDDSGESNSNGQKSNPSGQDADFRSYTDEAFKKNENRLHSSIRYRYANIPDVDLDDVILDHKFIWSLYKTHCEEFYIKNPHSVDYVKNSMAVHKENFLKLRKDTNRAVSYLVKEFELRKNADQMKRASVAKSGELNMDKIHAYKFSEDIFKKITVIPGGKSHGLVMFLDWSGSMAEYMKDTIKQLYCLVSFCRKVNIPFEVYAFSDGCSALRTAAHELKDAKVGDIELYAYKLMNIFSSRMSANEFSYASVNLVKLAYGDYYGAPVWMTLNATPLNEAIISAMKIVPKFQKDNNLQIVNTVFLTDGEGHSNSAIVGELSHMQYTGTMVVRDPVTKREEVLWDHDPRKLTSILIKLLKARTKSNVLGFYVLSAHTFKSKVYQFFNDKVAHDEIRRKFRTEKFLTIKSEGYDEYYLINSSGMKIDEDAELVVEENSSVRKLLTAFTKYAGNRNNSRVILNKFIGMIT